MFDVRCSMFDVRCSMFDVRCSVFDVRCFPQSSIFHLRSPLPAPCSLLLAPCSLLLAPCSLLFPPFLSVSIRVNPWLKQVFASLTSLRLCVKNPCPSVSKKVFAPLASSRLCVKTPALGVFRSKMKNCQIAFKLLPFLHDENRFSPPAGLSARQGGRTGARP